MDSHPGSGEKPGNVDVSCPYHGRFDLSEKRLKKKLSTNKRLRSRGASKCGVVSGGREGKPACVLVSRSEHDGAREAGERREARRQETREPPKQ